MLAAVRAVDLEGDAPGDRGRAGALGLHAQRLGVGEHGQVGTPQHGRQVLPVAVRALAVVVRHLELPVPDLRGKP
jgi:hypothetical protein